MQLNLGHQDLHFLLSLGLKQLLNLSLIWQSGGAVDWIQGPWIQGKYTKAAPNSVFNNPKNFPPCILDVKVGKDGINII